MVRGKEFKVIIKETGHILLDGKLIAILAEWNKFEDLDSDDILSQLREKESCLLV